MQTDPVPDRRGAAAARDAGGAMPELRTALGSGQATGAGGGQATGAGGVRIALNRHRQRELYGCLLGDRVRRLTAVLGITQARLARTLGLSPAMLSQLASARRVKIGDPAVLARLQLLDQRCDPAPPRGSGAVEALLEEVGRARLQWTAHDAGPRPVRPERRSADATVSPLHHRPPADPCPAHRTGPPRPTRCAPSPHPPGSPPPRRPSRRASPSSPRCSARRRPGARGPGPVLPGDAAFHGAKHRQPW